MNLYLYECLAYTNQINMEICILIFQMCTVIQGKYNYIDDVLAFIEIFVSECKLRKKGEMKKISQVLKNGKFRIP